MQFSEVIGQHHLKQLLINEINSKKISHAKLFLGKEGHGVLPLALAYVQYLFCKNKQENDSCGTCDSCLKVQNLQHPDLHFIYPIALAEKKSCADLYPKWRSKIKENPYFSLEDWTNFIDPKGRRLIIGVDASTEILKSLTLKAFEGRQRVVVIWMAEEMNDSAANKILKVLEEPPLGTYFILVGRQHDKFLTTILSRTQFYRVPKIETTDLSKHLREAFELNISKADSITLRSEGDYLEAVQMLHDSSDINEERELFIELMRSCYKKDVNKMLDWCENMDQYNKEFQKNFLMYCLYMMRQSLMKNYTDDVLMRASNEEAEFLKNFARFISGNNIADFNDMFSKAYYYIERNANTKLIFTNICFNVMRYIHAA